PEISLALAPELWKFPATIVLRSKSVAVPPLMPALTTPPTLLLPDGLFPKIVVLVIVAVAVLPLLAASFSIPAANSGPSPARLPGSVLLLIVAVALPPWPAKFSTPPAVPEPTLLLEYLALLADAGEGPPAATMRRRTR